MVTLEELKPGLLVRGLAAGDAVRIETVSPLGDGLVSVIFRTPAGHVDQMLLYRADEARLEIATADRPWSFSADGALLRLALEAYRIRLAHLSDPYMAVHTSEVEPLPHQITAVYEKMLPRQPLRFLLADDPGAGKTIMAGLLIKELRTRGDVQRCLIVCPGSLVEQWQDEMRRRFGLDFNILTNERAETSVSGNVFHDNPLLIARLDHLARRDDLQAKLKQVDWDLIICDEAHKMSATFFGGEIQYTRRYRLGQLLAANTRHFLLMTATPHNGKEEDFQLFLGLLDPDRFEGKFRDGVHQVDVSDLMRRMVKEQLLRFDATPLFPERQAHTLLYELSPAEADLYEAVTDYVRTEWNRADSLEANGRGRTVGFALTVLQRRLASSPEAIYQSLRRRRKRLEERLHEAQQATRRPVWAGLLTDDLSNDDWEDLEDAPAEEVEALEEQVVDQATAARTVAELHAEIERLAALEQMAAAVRSSGQDCKWDQLRTLLLDEKAMLDGSGRRNKLVIFTEHRDTLNYLHDKISVLLGRPEAIVTIHGGMRREERARAQHAFTQDRETHILLATDAAGEGINLQRAHLMINYDLPWNPNRLEQRFGRIHRIGQSEVCHLWNLVAGETREGDVYRTLLDKLDKARQALGGAVFDVLDKAISGQELRALMIAAIRYGERPDVRARSAQQLAGALDQERLQSLIEDNALVREIMDAGHVHQIRAHMEQMEARRLQPHYIAPFFVEALRHLGGTIHPRESGRWEITYLPAELRRGRSDLLPRYQRITFDKALHILPGKPEAELVYPGRPLLDSVIDALLARYGGLLRQGAVLIADNDPSDEPRALFYLEHSIHDSRPGRGAPNREISRRLQFVETPFREDPLPGRVGRSAANQPLVDPSRKGVFPEGAAPSFRDAGYAPHLDLRPPTEQELAALRPALESIAAGPELAQQAVMHAAQGPAAAHLAELRAEREPLIDKIAAAVRDRLTKEIIYSDNQAVKLAAAERSGDTVRSGRRTPGNNRLNSELARRRAQELRARLDQRLAELDEERRIHAKLPNVVGAALVVPAGLLRRLDPFREDPLPGRVNEGLVCGASSDPSRKGDLKWVEMAAMHAVAAAERRAGRTLQPVYRTESYDYLANGPGPADPIHLIEVKGAGPSSTDITVTRNEMLHALNKPDAWRLALVRTPAPPPDADGAALEARLLAGQIDEELAAACKLRMLRPWFTHIPEFGETGRNFGIAELWESPFREDPLPGRV